MFDAQPGNLRDYDYAHEFQPLPEGEIFAQLFRDACFIAMSSAMLRRSAVEEVWRSPRPHPARSRLLPVCRDRAPLSRTRCPGGCLPLSRASRQHVGVGGKPAATAKRTAVYRESVGREPRSAHCRLSPHDVFHRLGPGGDARPAHVFFRICDGCWSTARCCGLSRGRSPGLAQHPAPVLASRSGPRNHQASEPGWDNEPTGTFSIFLLRRGGNRRPASARPPPLGAPPAL